MRTVWKLVFRLRVLCLLLPGICSILSCHSQSPDNLPAPGRSTGISNSNTGSNHDLPVSRGQVRFNSYTVEDGLSMNTVHDLLQDRTGYIWVATEDDLNRFDGYSFKVYRANPSDLGKLNSSNIQSLFLDREGYLWLGGYEGGIVRYDPYRDHFQQFSPDAGSKSIQLLIVNAIRQDQSGNLWFGTSDGLYKFDLSTAHWSYLQADTLDAQSINSNIINTLLVDSTNHLWIGTDRGLDVLSDRDQYIHYKSNPDDPYSLSGESVNTIYQDRDGNIWIGTDGGLNRFDPKKETFEHWLNNPGEPTSISDDQVTAILEDDRGEFWIGTRNGLNLFNPQNGLFTHFTANPDYPNSIRDDWVQALAMDSTGGLWIATAYGGVNYYHPLSGQFKHYLPAPSTPDRISENSVWSVYQDDAEVLWLGTNGGGLKQCTLEPFLCREYRHDEENPTSLADDVIMDIYPDEQGGLWLATWGGGLNHFDSVTEEFKQYRSLPGEPTSISSDTVWLIYEDNRGILWIGTESGLNAFDPDTAHFKRYMHNPADENSISNDIIVGLFEDSAGQLWVGTQDGLNILNRDTGRFTRFYHDPGNPDSLSHNTIFTFYEDRNGTLWIGTYGGGLNQYDSANGTFAHYRVSEGLVNDSIYGILADDDGNMWISTNNGISMFDPEREIFKNFGIEDGLQAREFNFNGYFKNKQGEMFFSGVNGVTAFYPEDICDNPFPPEVVLQSISQGGIPLELDQSDEYLQELTLRWPNNFFDFEFAALSYFQADQNQHAYLLENFDDNWNMIGDRRYGRYTNLPGGSYILRIKGANNDGLWNEEGKSIVIRVVPPLWQNPWFLGAIGLIVFASIGLGYGFRVQALKTRAKELEEQIEIRTNEINTRRRQIEALYKADEDLYRHLELDQVLQALVDTAVEILKADKGSLLCWDENREYLLIRASHNFNPETVAGTRIPRGGGVVGQVAATGETIAVEDTSSDPRITQSIVEIEGIRSFIQVPIKTGEEVFGVFSADFAQPRSFSEDEKRLVLSLAQRAAIAIQNAQIYQQAQELAASQERNRLARELHDAVTQTLFSASLIAEALPALWERDPQKGRERLAKLRQMSRGALAEMRALLLELRPAALLETNLDNLLRQLGEAVMGRENIKVEIHVEGDCKLPSDVHIALYRIAQEAVNNIIKHARASTVQIGLIYLYDKEDQLSGVELAITDDGRGFKSQESTSERLGLGIMGERAESIGAFLEIESQPDHGTRVVVKWLK